MSPAARLLLPLLVLAAPAPLCAQTTRTTQVAERPATAEDQRPNNPAVPDAYALTGRFDRIVVMRMKFRTDLLRGIEQLVRQEHIENGVILSAIGSVRGYRIHQVASRDFPSRDQYVDRPTTPADLVAMNGYIVHGRVHAHVVLGSGASTVAGHLEPGTEVFTFAIVTVGVLPDDVDLSKLDQTSYR